MSGFVAILNKDGNPIDSDLLNQMVNLMEPTAPDFKAVWIDGSIGLSSAMLRTTFESENEKQPHTFDQINWIVGDIRLDRRNELIEKLESKGRKVSKDSTDSCLVLHSYKVWGEDCLDYISGDFAFVIWDKTKKRLFCARDHFGIEPFYYSEIGNTFIVSNYIDCFHLHPKISESLNEVAVGDYLIFGFNQSFTKTFFTDIKKLAPAHSLVCSNEGIKIKKYWEISRKKVTLRYKKADDYVEHFKELFTRAVSDRLRTDKIGTHLSGGMDSTSIAATAYKYLQEKSSTFDFRAYSIVYRELFDEEEGVLAEQVANYTGFPIEYLTVEDYISKTPNFPPEIIYPEPLFIPEKVPDVEVNRRISKKRGILLVGFGGDPLFSPSPYYWQSMLRKLQFRNILLDSRLYIKTLRRLPSLGIRTRLRGLRHTKNLKFSTPKWFKPDFVKRTQLAERIRVISSSQKEKGILGMTTESMWSNIFAIAHPGHCRFPIKVRFPFFDLRLVQYVQSIPPSPWCEGKFLLREAMKGMLPDSVRLRNKTPLGFLPHIEFFKMHSSNGWMNDLIISEDLDSFMDSDILSENLESFESLNPMTCNYLSLSIQFSYWIQSKRFSN